MNSTFFSNSFYFVEINFSNYHHTDNRCGAPSHYFAYMLKGNCKITTETETVEICEGEFFYIPYKCSYQSYWYGSPDIKFISLGFIYMPNIENKTYPVQTIPFDKKTAEMFFEVISAKPKSAKAISIFYALAAKLIPFMKSTTPCRTKEIVSRTEDYLLYHPFANAKELAKNCAISEAALYSAFKKASDTTPNELKSKILLEKAKELLICTNKTVEDISDALKFSSSSYFRKKFKAHFGITPKEMRKRYRI